MPRLLGRLAFYALLFAPATATARPAYRRALVDLLSLPAASRLNDCRVCHLPRGKDTDESAPPHNAFGKRLAALRSTLRKAGKPSDITARLLAVAGEDADGDGVANLIELLAGTFPGDPTDKPSAEQIATARVREAELLASLKAYRWRPFDRVERPAIPLIRNSSWARNPIDSFIAAEHERRSLVARPEAQRDTLLRRVTIDLTGLPPTVAEIEAFRRDGRPDAYERLVDRLLDSPRYGERWGRHWMDVWRYSDWAGFGAQIRDSQPHVWHWRDWIVDSLNHDKPYDRMVHEMLAGDELAPADPDVLRATGYLVRNFKLLSREKWLQDAVDHTSMGFLGLTLGCARCHDHMYDPLTQKEYYQVRAIFTPHNVRTDHLPGAPSLTSDGLPRAYDADLTAATHLFIRGDDRTPDKKPLAPGVPEALGGKFAPRNIILPRDAFDPERRPFVGRMLLDARRTVMQQADDALTKARFGTLRLFAVDPSPLRAIVRLAGHDRAQEAILRAEHDLAVARAAHAALEAELKAEALEQPGVAPSAAWNQAALATTQAQRRLAILEARRTVYLADLAAKAAPPAQREALRKQATLARQTLDKVSAVAKTAASTAYARRAVKTFPPTSTGRRLAFARWITRRDNPLAARVAVNHLWLRHFGRGLVPSAFDFGRNGQPPSHAALLDWLAVEFMERDWGMKDLHRLLLTSMTYRQASTPQAGNLARDPDNVYLWRFTPRRVEAEVVRDAIFYVADRLDLTMGGPEIPHEQGLTRPRRSLYFQHAAEKQMELLQIFDVASVVECYQRRQAIMPQQSLALLNSDLVVRHAQIAARLIASTTDDAFIRGAFERLLSRAPTAEEVMACREYLADRKRKYATARPVSAAPALRAREQLVSVLMNHHEFLTIR